MGIFYNLNNLHINSLDEPDLEVVIFTDNGGEGAGCGDGDDLVELGSNWNSWQLVEAWNYSFCFFIWVGFFVGKSRILASSCS